MGRGGRDSRCSSRSFCSSRRLLWFATHESTVRKRGMLDLAEVARLNRERESFGVGGTCEVAQLKRLALLVLARPLFWRNCLYVVGVLGSSVLRSWVRRVVTLSRPVWMGKIGELGALSLFLKGIVTPDDFVAPDFDLIGSVSV